MVLCHATQSRVIETTRSEWKADNFHGSPMRIGGNNDGAGQEEDNVIGMECEF